MNRAICILPGATWLNPTRRGRNVALRGFTLVECLVVCALVAILASGAIQGFSSYQQRAGRLDAVDALMRIQQEQENHRALHGWYAVQVGALRGAAEQSRQGLYRIGLQDTQAESYVAVAQAMGPQTRDVACQTLTLAVHKGSPEIGPSAACWNR